METLHNLQSVPFTAAFAKGWLTNTCTESFTCKRACIPGQERCNEHLWCNRCNRKPKVRHGVFCYEHTCKHESCLSESLKWGLCRRHTCVAQGCTGETLPSANFCKSHKVCPKKGCTQPKQSQLWWYQKGCAKHKGLICEHGECLQRKKHGQWCREHYLEVTREQRANAKGLGKQKRESSRYHASEGSSPQWVSKRITNVLI